MPFRSRYTYLCIIRFSPCPNRFLQVFFCLAILTATLVFSNAVHPAWALGTPPSLGNATIQLTPIITKGLEQPVFLTVTGHDTTEILIVEQRGRIRRS